MNPQNRPPSHQAGNPSDESLKGQPRFDDAAHRIAAPEADNAGRQRSGQVAVEVSVSEFAASQAALRASDVRYRLVVENAPDYAIFTLNLQRRVTSWNIGAERVLGWPENEILGQSADVIFMPEDQKAGIPAAEVRAAVEQGRVEAERWHRHSDSSPFWGNAIVLPLRDQAGSIQGLLKLLRDKTAERRDADELRDKAEFLSRVLDSSGDCIKVLDLDGRLQFINAGGLSVMEIDDLEAVRGHPWVEFWGDDRPVAARSLEEAKAGGTARFRGRAATAKGKPRWWNVHVTPMLGEGGRPERLLAISRDITEQTHFDEALRESEARRRQSEDRYRTIIESALDHAIITLDLAGHITGWNPGAEKILGWKEAEVLGQAADFIFTPEDRAAGAPSAEMQTAMSSGRAVDERWHVKRDGRHFWGSGQLTLLRDGTLQGYLKILRDHTEQRLAAEHLRASEERFRTLAEGIPHLVFRSRSSGMRTWGSPQWVAYSGLSGEASLGLGWLDAIHPDDRAATMTAWAEAEERGLFSVDHRVRRASDGAYRWFQCRALPVRNETGRTVEWLGTATDIDDQIRAAEVLTRSRQDLEAQVAARTSDLERALNALRAEAVERSRAEEALRHSQKMEAVGQLTGGIAHDFNNMLQGITGSVEMVRHRLQAGRTADALRLLDTAREAARRAGALTHRLLAFARRQRLEPKPVSPDELIAGMADLIRRTVGPAIRLELLLRDGAWGTFCDTGELESALLNLCINARDAMPQGGRLTIGTEDVRLSARDVADEGAAPGEYVVVSVADTGEGIPQELMERVFEPFFTTKPLGQGTGLGLSQVYGFVRQSGGIVQLDSTPSCGTTVRLCLPRHEAGAYAPEAAPLSLLEQAGSGVTVLLVDDEAGVRVPAAERLRELGYQVLEAADGPAALRIVDTIPKLDLLVTDVGLPNGMNGRQLAEAVRQRQPSVPVLFVTGYAAAVLPPGFEVIDKPFDLDTLARHVQAILAE